MRSKLSVLLLLINSLLFSQPEISWLREYDTSSLDECGFSVTETNASDGYIICGYRNTQIDFQDLFLIRTDLSGDTIWTKQYGVQNGSDYGMKILSTGDGYVIGGMKVKTAIGFWSAWLLKINENGDTLWSKTLLDSARIMSVCNMPDGGFAVTGISGWENTSKAFSARTDFEGNIIWLNYYGNYQNTYGMDIIHSQDSSLFILGSVYNPPALIDNLWLLKINEDGSEILDRVFEPKYTWGKIHQAVNGDLILGVENSGSVSFLKLDANGFFLDSLNFSMGNNMPEIIQSPDLNFICVYSELFGSSDYSVIKIKKLDNDFNSIWEQEISGERNYSDVSFIVTEDDGLLITGRSSEIPYGDNLDILLVRLDGDIVPVELTSFEGIMENDKVILTWKTSSETNNYGFEIERKIKTSGSLGWEDAGFVEGNGTSTVQHSYSYTDPITQSGIVSYRLRQMDLDGAFTYSKEITVASNPVVSSLSQNYPNPFNPVTTINYSLKEESEVSIAIYDILGRKVSTVVNEIKRPGNYSIDVDGSKLAGGIYIYRLTSGRNSLTRRMVLLK